MHAHLLWALMSRNYFPFYRTAIVNHRAEGSFHLFRMRDSRLMPAVTASGVKNYGPVTVASLASLLTMSRCRLPSVHWHGKIIAPAWNDSQQTLWIILSNQVHFFLERDIAMCRKYERKNVFLILGRTDFSEPWSLIFFVSINMLALSWTSRFIIVTLHRSGLSCTADTGHGGQFFLFSFLLWQHL